MNFFRKKKVYREYSIEPEEIFLDSMNPLEFDQAHHEGRIEQSISSNFFSAILLLCGLGVLIFGGRIVYLQIFKGNAFASQAENQSLIVSTIPPPRGLIVDTFGEILANNTSSFDVIFYGAEFKKAKIPLETLKGNLIRVIDIQYSDIVNENFPKSEKNIPQEVVILQNIEAKTILAIQTHADDLPGILVEEHFRRLYGRGRAFSPVIGYSGLSKDDAVGTLEGKLGIEQEYDTELKGKAGKKIIQVDAARQVQRIKTIEEPTAGKTLVLEINAGLQEKAYSALSAAITREGQKAGAVVAVDPRNGAIRALVSYPSFDNNLFTKSLSQKDFENIFLNPNKPLYNRAISGEYAPGSTIKIIMGAAAIAENIIDPLKQIFSAGFIKIPNPFRPGESTIFKDWKALGWVDLRHALAMSSNVYFYSVGGGYEDQQGLGISRIKEYETLFGLGSKTGIDLPGENSGNVPDPEWKATYRPSDPIWRIGDTYNVSIGQGDTLATPLQVAMYTTAFANRGTIYTPHLIQKILDPVSTSTVYEHTAEVLKENFIDQQALDTVREGMRLAVTGGLSQTLLSIPTEVAGKTGTAETGRPGDHSWFTGFAPYDNPELVLTILIEHGKGGSVEAVPVAKEILDWYFRQRASTTVVK